MVCKNRNLIDARIKKDDEYYTQLEDIEKEVTYYKNQLEDKIVYLNCDNPKYSQFWTFFINNFKSWNIKGLVATYYEPVDGSTVYCYTVSREDIDDINKESLDKAIKKEKLEGNGDFRSEECIKLMEKADVIVTNPPFSLFIEYVTILMNYSKDFLVLGNKNAYKYDGIFSYIIQDKIRVGYTSPKSFLRPDGTVKNMAGLCRWFTTLETGKQHDHLKLTGVRYNEEEYPMYDNYNAIEVPKVSKIPMDYAGIMGVPITYLDKHNPNDFEILGKTDRHNSSGLCLKKYTKADSDNFNDLNASCVLRTQTGYKGVYTRILIRNKHLQ